MLNDLLLSGYPILFFSKEPAAKKCECHFYSLNQRNLQDLVALQRRACLSHLNVTIVDIHQYTHIHLK